MLLSKAVISFSISNKYLKINNSANIHTINMQNKGLNIKGRLALFLKYRKIGQAKFAEIVGLSKGFANNVGDSIRTDNLEKISAAYPELNTTWLLTGEGEMLKGVGTETCTSCIHVPLLPMAAQGGSLNDFVISVKSNDCEMVISPIKGAEFAMPVSGDSMSPEYPSGSQILIKRINEKAFIDWGKVYVLDTCNGTVIKKLMPSVDGDKEVVRCLSINPEYPPFEVSLCDVYGVYKVLLCMSIK